MPIYKPETFTPDISVGYLAKRIFQTTLKGLEPAFAGEDISYLQWSALISVWYGRGKTCRALAHEIGHDKGATTRLLDGLEERGLLVRDRNSGDRRVINLALTEEGQALADRCMRRIVALWNGWLADWSPEDAARLISDLQRLHATLEAAVEDDESCD